MTRDSGSRQRWFAAIGLTIISVAAIGFWFHPSRFREGTVVAKREIGVCLLPGRRQLPADVTPGYQVTVDAGDGDKHTFSVDERTFKESSLNARVRWNRAGVLIP